MRPATEKAQSPASELPPGGAGLPGRYLSEVFGIRSLKTRLTLGTLVTFVCGIWLAATYFSQTLKQDIEGLLKEQQMAGVVFVADDINRELTTRLAVLAALAGEISPAVMTRPAALQAVLEAHPLLLTLFNDGIAAAGTDGVVMADLPHVAGRIGADFSERDYVAGPLQQGRATVGKPVRSKLTQAPSVVLAVPIKDPQGRVMGVLAGVINLGQPSFLDQIAQNRYGRSGSYSLVARQHRLVVTSSEKALVMAELPAPGVIPELDRAVAGDYGSVVYTNSRGVEVLASSHGVPVARWYLTAQLPVAEAFAPVRQQQQRMLLGAAVLSLLVGVAVGWLVRRQLAPLLGMAGALSRLTASGAPLEPLRVDRPDEIGQVADSFNLFSSVRCDQIATNVDCMRGTA